MEITINAFAKLNLSLDIKGITANGYHEIETVFQSVSLCDRVKITATPSTSRVICDKGDIPSKDNICYLALRLFAERTGITENHLIEIEKSIPLSAGLAGGSADAAATLFGLNTLYGKPLSEAELCDIGARLGADVPFCLRGGTCLARGIGERLEPLPSMPSCDIIIIKEGEKSSTGALYKRMDELEAYPRPDLDSLLSGLRAQDLKAAARAIRNVFEEAWIGKIEPQKELLMDCGAIAAQLSGSGPSVFGIFQKGEGEALLPKIKRLYPEAHLCRPMPFGLEIVSAE